MGYWIRYFDRWPVTSLTLGSQVHTNAELLGILANPPQGDASLILARQLIAVMLNTAGGSDPSPICETVVHANGLLSDYGGKLPYSVKASSAAGQAMLDDAEMLQAYTARLLSPGCRP